jgi:membrane associated rhomboid family serine protease
LLVPIGVENHTVDRLPVVGVSLIVACVAAFLLTHSADVDLERRATPVAAEAYSYWLDHPYLEIDDPGLLNQRRMSLARRGGAKPPDPAVVAEEQAELDSRMAAVRTVQESRPAYRYGLVPARGFAQRGWVSHMFLHAGWMHLIGNMFFFFLVGLLLEDAWGRPLFLGFYLIGGVIAAAAQFALDPHANVPLIGASGAIAACMGAFSYRFGTRNIRMGYFFPFSYLGFFRYGTFLLPAWLWAGSWFLTQLAIFWLGISGNVATMAHIAGFGFGFVTAVAFGASGFEAKVVAPAVERQVAWTAHAGIAAGQAALESGDLAAATAQFRSALHQRSDDHDALLGMARIAMARGTPRAAAPWLERAAMAALSRSPDLAYQALEECGSSLDFAILSPALLFRLASALHEEGFSPRVERLLAAAGASDSIVGAKALLRLYELRVSAGWDPAKDRAALVRLSQMPALPPEMASRVHQLLSESGASESSAPTAADPAPPSNRVAPRVELCQLAAVHEDSWDLGRQDGSSTRVAFKDVRGVSVGLVVQTGSDHQIRKMLMMDLILSYGDGQLPADALRLTGRSLSLDRVAPGVPPGEAFQRLLAALVAQSQAVTHPSLEDMRKGAYPTFASIAEFDAAAFGSRS